ncbi:MAG: FMN-binding protein [Actinomycetota bacterium]|nr:FMN-binding protein [Actinomycetota bacterium]MDA8281099.1 FMN-binding protein [Actinomycetota bacterium]
MIGATAAGLAGVLSFHSKTGSFSALPASTTAPQHQQGSSGGSAGSTSSGSSGAPASSGAGTASSGSSSSGSTAGGTSAGAGSSGGGPASPPPAKTTPTTTKLTGKVEQFGYGQLAVTVTLTGTRITDVAVSSLQVIDPTSQYIEQQAVPYLKREVLQAQSANIQGVSGASYTAQAYALSLQSALAKRPKG